MPLTTHSRALICMEIKEKGLFNCMAGCIISLSFWGGSVTEFIKILKGSIDQSSYHENEGGGGVTSC